MARSEHHPNGLIHYNPQLAFRGYTLFASESDAYLIDMHGRFVHRWRCDKGIVNPELLANGNLIAQSRAAPDVASQRGLNGLTGGCYELDWDSNLTWEYEDELLHHDYERLPSGNTLLVKWVPMPKRFVRRVKGGYHADGDDPNSMLGDVVIEVTPEGKTIKEWKSWEHLDFATDLICPLEYRREWTHCNSISLSPKGNWLLSFRRINALLEVQPKSGRIVWKILNLTAHQHDAKYVSDNTITVFDNGVHGRGPEFSRAVEIDVKKKEIIWQYNDDPPFSFFTFMAGGVDQLPNGNHLICESAKGHFLK